MKEIGGGGRWGGGGRKKLGIWGGLFGVRTARSRLGFS